MKDSLPIDQILQGHCVDVLDTFPANSIDLVFADPPYNLQLQQDLHRPDLSKVEAVDDGWDHFTSFAEYDAFTRRWLAACQRVLKPDGAIWVIGTYHNIYRVGAILQDLGFWILNDIVWIKVNPMPNFHGVRFTNAHETLLWAGKSRKARYTFNHHAMKALNDDLQMRSDWLLPICKGPERIKRDGKKIHSTQKPEALLYRVLLSSSRPGDVILDPFFGSGTTGAVAKKLHRHWIGIEQDPVYIEVARERIAQVQAAEYDAASFDVSDQKRLAERLPFGRLLEHGLLTPGQALYFRGDWRQKATLKPDGKLMMDGRQGTIHMLSRQLLGGKPGNGWELWYYEGLDGQLHPIDDLRQALRDQQSAGQAGNDETGDLMGDRETGNLMGDTETAGQADGPKMDGQAGGAETAGE